MTGTVFFVREPAANYEALPLLLVDSSVLAAIYFAEPGGAEVAERIAGHRLAAPEIVDYEIANVGMNKVRRKVMPAAAAAAAIADFLELRLDRHAVAPDDAFDTALRHDLSAYDAAYLHLALTLGVPLVTLDQKLAQAARSALAQAATERIKQHGDPT